VKGNRNQSQQQCCDYIDKKNTSPNRITIRQFIQSYTNSSNNQFYGQQGLKGSYFSKTSQFSSNLFKFDGKDATDTKNNEENPSKEAEVDNNTGISDHNVYDISNTSNTNNKEILKSDLMTKHNNPQDISLGSNNPDLFECYYCDEFSVIVHKMDYERHVVLNHPNKLASPSIADLKKMNTSPKGKKWEI
jgi:hypothetical protein